MKQVDSYYYSKGFETENISIKNARTFNFNGTPMSLLDVDVTTTKNGMESVLLVSYMDKLRKISLINNIYRWSSFVETPNYIYVVYSSGSGNSRNVLTKVGAIDGEIIIKNVGYFYDSVYIENFTHDMLSINKGKYNKFNDWKKLQPIGKIYTQ